MITHEGGKLRMLNISDELTHECLARISHTSRCIGALNRP
jgi:hypothetical protein